MKKIIVFYGEECIHCHNMMPIIDKLSKEMEGNVIFDKQEVWHNQKNLTFLRKYKDYMKESCGEQLLIPIFFYEKYKKSLCGEVSYNELKKWIESLK